MRRAAVVLSVLAVVVVTVVSSANAQQDPNTCTGPVGGGPPPAPGGPPLTFGIFPGGAAGQIGPPAPAKPESDAAILDALGHLRGGDRPFVVHLYRAWRNPASDAEEEQKARERIDHYRRHGYLVEYVVRYRPEGDREGDAAAYAEFIRGIVRRFGAELKALQVTNEVNQPTSPDSSDGPYPGARDALIQGVIAAKDEARKHGYKVEIGFNWFYRTTPPQEADFWRYLGSRGGPAFVNSLDWVGLDAYPGTFFPPAGTGEGNAMVNAFAVMRECFLPAAGIPASVPIHIQENGWPTGPGRSYEKQHQVLIDMVKAAYDYRRTYNITDYRWFDLRDADTSDPSFTQQYGIMRDDYTPKPAFGEYARRIAMYGVPLGCSARAAPHSEIARRGVRLTRRRVVVRGTAGDTGCPGAARGGVRRVDVSVFKRVRKRCRYLTPRGRLSRRRSCKRPIRLRARGTTRWRLSKRVRLPRGRYRVVVRAVDDEGNGERPHLRNRARESVR